MTILDPTSSGRPGGAIDGIVTPEAVVLDLETAGLGSRVAAALVDVLAMWGMLFVGGVVAVVVGLDDASAATTFWAILVFAVLFGYPIVFELALRGRTPGKAALGLRVVTVAGAPVRARDVVLRAMGGVVDKLVPPGGITGALFVMWSPRHQRVGDLIAGTIVIRDPAVHAPAPALWFTPPPHLATYAETLDPTAITVEQYTVVRAFLTRAATLPPATRAHIAHLLADRLTAVMRHRRPDQLAPEEFLVCAMARYQRRTGPARGPTGAAVGTTSR